MNGEQALEDCFQGPHALPESTTVPLKRDAAALDSPQPEARAGSDGYVRLLYG